MFEINGSKLDFIETKKNVNVEMSSLETEKNDKNFIISRDDWCDYRETDRIYP